MTRERMDKAAKKAAKTEERWGAKPERRSVWEICDLCESRLCINNYPDAEPRPLLRFMGMSHCLRCPPNYKRLIRALQFIKWASQHGHDPNPIAKKARDVLAREPEVEDD